MTNWRKHPFPLLLYLEWVLLGIALLTALSLFIPHPRHHEVSYPAGFNLAGAVFITVLGVMGWRLPAKNKFIQQVYILSGFTFSWLAIALVERGERVFPALLLVVVIRACMLFSWTGRVIVAILAFCSFLALQIMVLLRITLFGIPLGALPPTLRRLPPEELRRVWFGFTFNSALLFAFVLMFVLLLVSAVLAEHQSKIKLAAAHRRLREYARQIEDRATLEERNRLAREIHDSVGHYLTAQSIQLENTAVFMVEDVTKAANHLEKARKLGKEALTNIRDSVRTLADNSSTRISIAQLIAEFKSNSNISICDRLSLRSIPNDINNALFRIIQEALTNITKHSQAKEVVIILESTGERALLSISDDGVGFDPNNNTTGFGLQSMAERTAALQGQFTIESKSDRGTQIKVQIPLTSSKDRLS